MNSFFFSQDVSSIYIYSFFNCKYKLWKLKTSLQNQPEAWKMILATTFYMKQSVFARKNLLVFIFSRSTTDLSLKGCVYCWKSIWLYIFKHHPCVKKRVPLYEHPILKNAIWFYNKRCRSLFDLAFKVSSSFGHSDFFYVELIYRGHYFWFCVPIWAIDECSLKYKCWLFS